MPNPFEGENGDFQVLMNPEGQYSIWPTFRVAPAGWKDVGQRGERLACLNWIEAHWTDMRPLSLLGVAAPKKH